MAGKDDGMRRALRWLWRLSYKIALVGLLLIGGSAMFVSAAARTFAEERPAPASSAISPEQQGDRMSAQEQEQARERARRGRLLFLASFLYEGALLFGFLALGGTRWLVRLVARFGGHWALALGAVLGILSLGSMLLTLPLDYYSGFIFAHQYGLSNQTTGQWLRDYLVSAGVGAVTGFPVLLLVYTLLRRAPRTWWLWVTAASVPISLLFMLIMPVFITPLFNKFTPIKDEVLRQEILAMAHRQGIRARDVYEMDGSRQSRAANAYVIGVGPTQRIVLYDTLLKEFTREEIEYVLAHEMGHYKLGHIYQGILFSVLGTLVGSFLLFRVSQGVLARYGAKLGFATLGHPASYPLLMALGFVLSLLAFPIGNAFSRHLEWQADRFAAETYPHWDAGIAAFNKLAKINVAEEDPPRWAVVLLHSHPSLAQRVAALEQVKTGHPHPWPLPRGGGQ